jgi:L-asparaginase
MTKAALSALVKHAKKGVVCVRSSRVPSGRVSRNVEVDDDATGTVASEELNPARSRVLLKLALLSKRDPEDVQRLFREY